MNYLGFIRRRFVGVNRFISSRLLRVESLSDFTKKEQRHLIAGVETIQTPELPSMHLMEQCRHLANDTYTSPAMEYVILDNAEYVCGSLDFNFVQREPRVIVRECSSTMSEAKYFNWRAALFGKVHDIDGLCFSLRTVSNNFYHMLIDNMPRLFALTRPEFRLLGKITILVPSNLTAIEKYILDKFVGDGMEIRQVEPRCKYRVERLLMVTFCTRQFVPYIPQDIRSPMLKSMLPKRPSLRNKRIYIARRSANIRRMKNEEEVIGYLKGLGFKDHVLEELSIDEQIALFGDAEAIIAPHGAGLSNILFSNGAKVLEIFPMDKVKPNYYFLTKMCNGEFYYLLGNEGCINNDFSVDIKRLNDVVSSMGLISNSVDMPGH